MASAAQAIRLGAALESMRGRLVTLTSNDGPGGGEDAGVPGDASDSGEEEEDDDEEEEEEDSDNEFDDEEEQEQEQEQEQGEAEAEG